MLGGRGVEAGRTTDSFFRLSLPISGEALRFFPTSETVDLATTQ